MKYYLIFILIPFFTFAQKSDPFSIDLRPRVIDNAKIIVNIEITNHLNRPIDYLEGFLSEYSSKGVFLNEKRVVLLYSYEPALQTGFSTIKTAKFDLGRKNLQILILIFLKLSFLGRVECLPGIKSWIHSN